MMWYNIYSKGGVVRLCALSLTTLHIMEAIMAQSWFWFTFSDGYSVCVRGMSKSELATEVRKHGKLVSKVRA
jgi:hypothetical protein